MSAQYYQISGTQATLMSTELNALAASAAFTAGAISSVGGTSGQFSNQYGGGGLGGYPLARFTLILAAALGRARRGERQFLVHPLRRHRLSGRLRPRSSRRRTPT